jgi:hypothetical protein
VTVSGVGFGVGAALGNQPQRQVWSRFSTPGALFGSLSYSCHLKRDV